MNNQQSRSQITGNSGLNYVSWRLSKLGWHVMPTIRNARGSDMFIVSPDETKTYGVQSKALSKAGDIPLGKDINKLQSDWWVLTINANSTNPICYILTIQEVKNLAVQDKNGGAWWLPRKQYQNKEYEEAWERILGVDTMSEMNIKKQIVENKKIILCEKSNIKIIPSSYENGQIKNGVQCPTLRSVKCRVVWEYLDHNPLSNIRDMKVVASEKGWNIQNTSIEFYRWRKFHGLTNS